MAHSIEVKRSARKALESLPREEHARVLVYVIRIAHRSEVYKKP